MSLLRLLTTGKSLVGLNESEIPLPRDARTVVAPVWPGQESIQHDRKIGGRAARSRCKGTEAGLGAQPANAERSAVAGSRPVRRARRCSLKAANDAGRVRVARVEERPVGAGSAPCEPTAPGNCAHCVPARLASPRGRPSRRSTKLPVQGELSLDKIKVVRNDLSDADLEVVPAQTADGSRRRNPGAAGCGEDSGEWSELGPILAGSLARARRNPNGPMRSARVHAHTGDDGRGVGRAAAEARWPVRRRDHRWGWTRGSHFGREFADWMVVRMRSRWRGD